MKGLLKLGKKEKLNPWFIGPFEILERMGIVAYRIALPLRYAEVHNIFHISMLRKYQPDPTHIIPVESLPLERDLTYEKKTIDILEKQKRKLRNQVKPMVKVLCQHHNNKETT